MDQALVLSSSAGPSGDTNLIPSEHELGVYLTMASRAAESKLYRGIGDQSAIVMQMLAARELGIGPMLAINGGLRIINGNVEISARLMTALIRRAKHTLRIIESTDEVCVIEGRRADTGETLRTSYSFEDARRAGLVKPGGGWMKYPRDMCFARAASRLARQLFSDVIGIGYVEGEISGAMGHGEPYDVAPPPAPPIAPPAVELLPVEHHAIERDPTLAFIDSITADDERGDWLDYIHTVGDKFGWTLEQTIEKFSADLPATKEKFNRWRKKRCVKTG